MMKYKSQLFLLLFLILLSAYSCNDSSQENYSKRYPVTLIHGLTIMPHESINVSALNQSYTNDSIKWNSAFNFMEVNDLASLDTGVYQILQNKVFAIVSEYQGKLKDQVSWESHRKYIDLQYVIFGKEKIGTSQIDQLSPLIEYDNNNDVINYEGEGKYYTADQSSFFIFFPNDAHRPSIKINDNAVKKIVIKIITS